MSQDINVGVLAEQINSKADIDLRNIDTTKCDIVIEYQEPTEENNYTWYRLYATGWVEQGGFVKKASFDTNNYKVTLPIPMDNTNFTITMSHLDSSFNSYELMCIDRNITDITLGMTGSSWQGAGWRVSGKVDPAVMLNHEILPSKAKNEEFEHRVIDFQKPTAENNYTWYRKYADGWVEQGGSSTSGTSAATMILPVVMANNKYVLLGHMIKDGTSFESGNDVTPRFCNRKTTSFDYRLMGVNGNDGYARDWSWRVEGMYAIEE